ncbi:MAG: ABC transporter permease [Oscillospiraceae bacterium]
MKKRGIGFYTKIYFKIIAQDIKSKMSYREDFIISMIGMIAMNLAGAVSFWIIFQNFPTVQGWNYYEMIFLYGFSLISATPAQCMFDNNWSLRMHVYSGDFIKYCFRPINIFFYFMSEIFDVKGLGQFAFGIVAVVYAWIKLELEFKVYTLLLFIVAAVSASLFVIAILNLAACTCFWIMNSFFALSLSNTLRDYAKYPVTIFGPVLRAIFTFVIPIGFMAFYPSQLFLRPESVSPIVWFTPLFGIIFFYISYKVWMKGAMSYNGTGS